MKRLFFAFFAFFVLILIGCSDNPVAPEESASTLEGVYVKHEVLYGELVPKGESLQLGPGDTFYHVTSESVTKGTFAVERKIRDDGFRVMTIRVADQEDVYRLHHAGKLVLTDGNLLELSGVWIKQ